MSRPLFAAVVACGLAVGAETTITDAERAALITQLEASRDVFEKTLATVSEAQWTAKPSPERWSPAEVAEHITLSEALLLSLVRDKMMKSPEQPSTPEILAKDATIRKRLTDRSGKAQSPEMLKPTNQWKDKESLLAAFRESRSKTIAYVRGTRDNLRAHQTPHMAVGPIDGYQWLLLLSAHCERHTAQIVEALHQSAARP